ncbi:MAG: MFS transporter, partial [candidate division Zixibacteria bacterium]|nr:MFS transporter [candidate division Zixibacteria bacterium]
MTAPKTKTGTSRDWRFLIRALKYRNYRLFFGGQGISLVGTWMQQIAISWLIYRLTGSAFLLGLTGFAGQIPTFILAPVAGVIADRMNRIRILIITQILSMVQAFLLSFLVLTDTIAVWHIIVLSVILGIINAFDMPIRQSLIADMIEKREDLGNAIALNSSIFNGARLIGPSLAGILIASAGEGICFLLNGISFGAVIFALLAMRVKPKVMDVKDSHILHELKEGFNYAFGFLTIRFILSLLALISLTGMQYTVLMPIIAKDILHGGSNTFGFLMAATGIGALMGAFYLASRKNAFGLERWLPLAASILGAGLMAVSISKYFWLSLILMLPIGFGMMVQMAASNTVLQTIVDDDKRGRLMSLYAMAFMGMTPMGSLLAGSMASRIGAPNTLIIAGIFCILGAILFAGKLPLIKQMIHPIYHKKGIRPD